MIFIYLALKTSDVLYVIMKQKPHEKISDSFFVSSAFSILSHWNWSCPSVNILFIRKDETHVTICVLDLLLTHNI